MKKNSGSWSSEPMSSPGGDMDEKCEILMKSVSGLSKEEALGFSRCFDRMMDKAYSWPLWAAAYIINGGCSDDAFMDFRASLISRGRQAFDRAISDPESLADEDLDDDAWFYEGYQYAVVDGVEAAVGFVVEREEAHPEVPSGEEWSEEKVEELFPRLGARFG